MATRKKPKKHSEVMWAVKLTGPADGRPVFAFTELYQTHWAAHEAASAAKYRTMSPEAVKVRVTEID